MKKKKWKKIANELLEDVETLEKELEHLRGCIPVFKSGFLGFELEIEGDVEPGTSRHIIGPGGNPFMLTLSYEDRKVHYTGLVEDIYTELDTE